MGLGLGYAGCVATPSKRSSVESSVGRGVFGDVMTVTGAVDRETPPVSCGSPPTSTSPSSSPPSDQRRWVGRTLTATQAATTHARSDADGGFMLALPPGSASFVATGPILDVPHDLRYRGAERGIVELKVEFNHGAM
ncbi:MAG: hypothetical protein U1E65_05425 [Myxococcota bacterium]